MELSYITAFAAGAYTGNIFNAAILHFTAGTNGKPLNKLFMNLAKCPSCGKISAMAYGLPVIGYFILTGKCRGCRGPIPLSAPMVQFSSGLLMAFTMHLSGINFYSLSIYFIMATALAIAVIDARTMIIPDILVLSFFIFSLFPVLIKFSLGESLMGLALMFGFFIIMIFIFPGSFGGGDLKFASAIGFFLGLEHSVVALECALISGALTGIIYAIWKKSGLRKKIPFGPFLSFGLIVSHIYGRELILLYYNKFF